MIAADPRPRFVDAGGVSWAHWISDEGAPDVVLLHGTLASHRMFDPLVARIAPRYTCTAVDWPGHGASGYSVTGWTADDLVEGLVAFIDQVGGGAPLALVGLSQGGAISLRTALRRPDLVSALVTLSAGPDGPSPAACRRMADLGTVLATGSDKERLAAVTGFQAGFHAEGWVADHPREAEIERLEILSHPREAMVAVTGVPATYDSVESELSAVRCPTLVMWGDHDPRAFWGSRMVDAIPDSRLVTVPDAGHHLLHDAPVQVVDHIAQFLGQHVSGRAS